MWLVVLLLVAAAVVALLPLAIAMTIAWRGAFPDRRRSTLPEWIGAAALVWIAAQIRLNTRAINR